MLLPGCQVPGPTTPAGTFKLDFSKIDAERADGAQRLAVFRLLDALAANPDELE